MSSERTVVVVGAGVVGLCTAWYARADGHHVIVLERGAADRDCCSLGNSGMIVPSHIIPLASPGVTGMALRSLFDPLSPLRLHPRLDPGYVRWCWRFWRSATREHVERSAPALRDLALLSRSCYEGLARHWKNPFGLVQRGLLVLCRSQHRLDEEARTASLVRELGIPAHVLDPAQTARLESQARLSVAGSVHYPLDSHLTPQALMATLIEESTQAGVEIRWSTGVQGWRTEKARVRAAVTARGAIEADEFVLASGSWSARVAQGLGIRLPLEAGKGYSLTLPQPRILPAMSSILSEARVAITPMGDSLRVAGTLELAGLDTSIDRARVRALLHAVPNYYPDVTPDDFAAVQPWSGLRPCTPDGLPCIGRPRHYDNLIVATGHAMMGVSLGPATGVVVGDLIAQRTPTIPLARFDPNRFY